MTMSMACEWAKNGIRVNAIAPTWCWTDLTSPKLRIDSFYNKLKQRIPIGRARNRDDIFGIVVFLASEASDFVNGAVIPLDGGAMLQTGFRLSHESASYFISRQSFFDSQNYPSRLKGFYRKIFDAQFR